MSWHICIMTCHEHEIPHNLSPIPHDISCQNSCYNPGNMYPHFRTLQISLPQFTKRTCSSKNLLVPLKKHDTLVHLGSR